MKAELMATSPLEVAKQLVGKGIPIFPTDPIDKSPLTRHGFKDASTDLIQIETWWSRHAGAMIGVPTGHISGILVIDIDRKNGVDGLATLQAIEAEEGQLPETLVVQTPSGGRHYIFRMPDIELSCGTGSLGPGIDHRANGGYVVWDGSITAAGTRYEVIADRPLADPPEWLIHRLSHRCSVVPSIARVIPMGTRNSTLASMAGSMHSRGSPCSVITSALLTINREQCLVPLDEGEVRRIADSIGRYEPRYSLTLTGAGERFRDLFASQVRFADAVGWMTWDGKRWVKDAFGAVVEMSKEIGKIFAAEASAIRAEEYDAASKYKTKLAAFAKKILDAPNKVADVAKSDPAIALRIEHFDQKPYLFNCANGVIDLRSGELRPHDPALLLTKCSPVTYQLNADAPTWDRFMLRVMNRDQSMVAYVERLFGMALSGDTREQVMAILYGTGANGKTTFSETLRFIFADYADVARQESLMVQPNRSVPHDLAEMRGARLVVANEPSESGQLDASRVKELTGGEMVKARQLYKESFTYRPEFLLTLVTNWQPEVQGADLALARRLHLIPFTETIPEGERDPELPRKLREESEGILTRLVQGCLSWQKKGLCPPEKVRSATTRYMSDNDLLGQFIEEHCETGPELSEKSSKLLMEYQTFASHRAETRISQRRFSALMDRRFNRGRHSAGVYFLGVRLRPITKTG